MTGFVRDALLGNLPSLPSYLDSCSLRARDKAAASRDSSCVSRSFMFKSASGNLGNPFGSARYTGTYSSKPATIKC